MTKPSGRGERTDPEGHWVPVHEVIENQIRGTALRFHVAYQDHEAGRHGIFLGYTNMKLRSEDSRTLKNRAFRQYGLAKEEVVGYITEAGGD